VVTTSVTVPTVKAGIGRSVDNGSLVVVSLDARQQRVEVALSMATATPAVPPAQSH
jgi:hypothetical protein